MHCHAEEVAAAALHHCCSIARYRLPWKRPWVKGALLAVPTVALGNPRPLAAAAVGDYGMSWSVLAEASWPAEPNAAGVQHALPRSPGWRATDNRSI